MVRVSRREKGYKPVCARATLAAKRRTMKLPRMEEAILRWPDRALSGQTLHVIHFEQEPLRLATSRRHFDESLDGSFNFYYYPNNPQ